MNLIFDSYFSGELRIHDVNLVYIRKLFREVYAVSSVLSFRIVNKR